MLMKCQCGKEAIIEIKYTGLKLCRSCFINFFESRVRKTINEKQYLKDVKKIAVALSGGKDSTIVLHILSKLAAKNRIELIAISIDGGVKNYEDITMENARKVCKSLDVEHHIFTFKNEFDYSLDDLSLAKPGQCNCGIFRRHLLNKKARELGAEKLATGHNLDDEVQSILMNTMRGDVKKIIRGEGIVRNEKFVPRMKILQKCPEDEVDLYAKLLYPDMDFSRTCPYRKEVLRLDIKKLLDKLEEKHPGIKFQIFEGNKKIREAMMKNMEEIGSPNECSLCGELCSGEICQTCNSLKEIDRKLRR